MAQKKSYSRYFIILQEDEKGYALASDKLPSGYTKLEIKNDKCKVSYYVQNLKKESAPYYMLLICNKKDVKKLLKLGELNIDEHGRAEVSYEYPVENVANFGVGVDKIVGAAIVRLMNSNIIPVMSGFASTDIPEWKGFSIIESELKRQEEAQEEKVEKAVEVKAEAKKEEQREESKEEQRNIFDEYEKKIEEEKVKDKEEEIKVIEEMPRNEAAQIEISNNEENIEEIEIDPEDERHKKKCKKDSCEIKHEEKHEENCEEKHEEKHEENCEEKHKEKHEEKCEEKHKEKHEDKCEEKKEHKHEYKCDENYPKDNISMLFMDVADGFEELQGICSEIKRCKWYKVPVYRPEDMTSCAHYNKYTVAYYPMVNYYPYIRKHGHFILGYKHDKDNKMKYLVYGVPGTKSRIDQPFGGRTGFVTWVPLVEGEEEENSQGYWLMFYDFRSSTIVIPVR
ncbi:hypothetical protein JK636_09840 [Clostridium sp. YIM B02515]|uniref:DUF7922 domain-containing protein n=1 Tax=Clostridium rhizosphaerae TaxID=2803861 RepID=A0ABS1T9N5_9CLOT|nr:hypothetical protein [Clostridium rhizosphaerae]MBL4936063.1 hypothetical protein [Clostridium rhizosphaerae]